MAFDPNKVSKHIFSWLNSYADAAKFDGFVLGVSGGIDSALVLALASEALGAENVLNVLMPSKFSSDHSVSDAEKLAIMAHEETGFGRVADKSLKMFLLQKKHLGQKI